MKTGLPFYKAGFLFLLFLISSTFVFSQQYLVNIEWSATFGNDTSNYFYKHAVVKTDASNNVYTLGSSITTTGHDFLLMKQDYTGDTLFIVNWNGDGDGEDVAMDMWIDNTNEYVYIVGGSYQNGTDSLDPVIVLVDNTGSILSYAYSSGATAYNDIYTSVTSNTTTSVFAVGSTGSSTGYDYLVTEFDFSISETGTDSYDNGYDDVAINVVCDGSGVYVAGISEPTDSTWDYYIICYKVFVPNFSSDYRNYAGSGQTHRPTDAVFKDNYYYVTGGVFNGTNYDIKTVCLDTTLTVVWEQTWNGTDGMHDISNSIKVDADGNVFITGKTSKANLTTDIVTIKYDNNGNEAWVNYYDGSNDSQNDVAYDLELNADNVYITGYVQDALNYITICYDTAGTMRWLKEIDGGFPYPNDLAIDGDGNIIMAVPLNYIIYTTKYYPYSAPEDQEIDTAGNPVAMERELIIKFNPAVIKSDAINDKGKLHGFLEDFLQDSTISKIGNKMDIDLTRNQDYKVAKIFVNFTIADSIVISNAGDTVDLNEPWSFLRVILPDSSNTQAWIDSLTIDLNDTNSFYEYDLYYVGKNIIYQQMSIPDDLYYFTGDQHNLLSSTYPNAHVNMQDAWSVYDLSGEPFIRAGIFDSGVEWDHEDFSLDGSSNFNQSIAGHGWDFINGGPITSSLTQNDDQNHGTRCAGIIGALRNNSTGMAGIAGGNGAHVPGVLIYNMRTDLTSSMLSNAIVEGATNSTLDLDISNHSYGNDVWELSTYYAHHVAWEIGIVQSIARGNSGYGYSWADNVPIFPACYENDWILCVGGNGNDGLRMDNTNGSGCDNYVSMQGQPQIDCVAPGTCDVVQITTDADPTNLTYSYFNGTSSAAPHVTGLGGLMLSYYNSPSDNFQNLIHDDVEHFVKNYASDRGTLGWDNETGYGILDAGAIFGAIDKTVHDIEHFVGYNNLGTSTTLINDNVLIYFLEGYQSDGPGWYRIDVVQDITTLTPPIGAGQTILDAWALPSRSLGFRDYQSSIWPTMWDEYCELISFTSTTVTLKSYRYILVERLSDNYFYPPGTYMANINLSPLFAYGVLLEGSIGVEQVQNNLTTKVYPNPTTGAVNVDFSKPMIARFEIFDILGKKIMSGNFNGSSNVFDISTLPSATYYLKIITHDNTEVFPIVKK